MQERAEELYLLFLILDDDFLYYTRTCMLTQAEMASAKQDRMASPHLWFGLMYRSAQLPAFPWKRLRSLTRETND
jgi:hypothetical protein